jgi:hypothetical protein
MTTNARPFSADVTDDLATDPTVFSVVRMVLDIDATRWLFVGGKVV